MRGAVRTMMAVLFVWSGFSPVPTGAAPRPWPDSTSRILVFADQLQESMTEAQRRFAATNLVGTQKMRRSEIRAIRAYNPDFLCLHYQLALGCGPAPFIIGDAWGSDWTFVNSREDWFLHNASGQRVHQTTWNWDVMDITYSGGVPNTGFPEYWITTCLARIRSAESDGVFADSFTLDGLFGQCNPSHTWFENVGACAANWVPSLNAYGRAIRAAFEADTNGYLFLPNLGGLITGWDATDYGVGHGGMVECFAFWGPGSYFDVADWRLQMDRTLALVRTNKIVLCQSYPEVAGYRDRMFALASYLLVKGSRTYISLVAEGGLEYYPEYRIDLGAAVGPPPATVAAAWYAPWGVYRRDYANGIVLVNPGAAAVNIASLGMNYGLISASGGGAVNASGGYGGNLATTLVSSLNMPAHSGAVLLRPARTITVAPSGGDYTTIQAALDAAQPGDTINVRAGVYNERLVVRNGGSAAGGYVTLRSYPGETAILDGTGRPGQNMILLNEKSYVRIQGLDIRNNTGVTDGSGIRLLGACRFIELLSNTIHALRGENAMGITVYGTNSVPASNLLIRANHIYDCDAAPSEALTLNGNVTDFEVSSNVLHDINNIGIDFIGGERDISPFGVCRGGVCRGNHVYRCRSNYGGGYAAGIYVDGGQNIVIEHNRIHECDLGLEVGCENTGYVVTGVVVRSNIIYNNDKAGLVFGGYDATRGRVNACQFLNNTCYRNDTLGDGNGELWIQYASNNVVRNNIFFCGPQNLAMATAGSSANRNNTLDYNLWFSSNGDPGNVQFYWRGSSYSSFAAYRAGSGQDAHSAFENPLFANGNVAAFDSHLLPASPAIDAGDPAYLPPADVLDADGNPRISGGRVDAGAYEYQHGGPGAPVVRITSPTDGAVFDAPADIEVSVDATDSDGAIVQVAVYAGALLIGTDATSPYEVAWNGVGAGTYLLTARATDSDGMTSTSLPVRVIVRTAEPTEVNLALASRGSTITGNNGANWSLLIDGVTNGYTKETGYGYTFWKKKPNSPGTMTLDLKGPCTISRMRLLLWDRDKRYYRYRIQGSLDGIAWSTIVDRTTGKWRGWQDVALASPVQAQFLRLTGTYCSEGKQFRVVEWEVYGTAGIGAARTLSSGEGFRPADVVAGVGEPPHAVAWRAADGNFSTWWEGKRGAGGWWLAIAYPGRISVRDVRVHWMPGSSTNLLTLGSVDADTWYAVPFARGAAELSYLWLIFPDDGSGVPPKVAEVEVYSTP